MRRAVLVGAALGVVLLASACSEPAAGVDIPSRASGQVVLDQAGILDGSPMASVLSDLPADVVALTFHSEDATLGEAHRAALALLEQWNAEVVLVAVARPGDFASEDSQRRRFFGVFPADRFKVPGGVRERIVEELVPPLAARNDWTAVFRVAAEEVGRALRDDAGP